jgi:uncharacterized glyoxalase superfamily protein PhnB
LSLCRIPDKDNNAAERQIRGPVVTRKNAGGVVPPGPDGRASAIIVAAVADVDVHHCAHAAEHGALISYGPADMSYGVREYGARDHVGQHWSFQSSPTTKETT